MLANTILPPFGYGQFLIIGIEMEKIELDEMIDQWSSEADRDVGIGKAFGFLRSRINELIDEVEALKADAAKLKYPHSVHYPYDSCSLERGGK